MAIRKEQKLGNLVSVFVRQKTLIEETKNLYQINQNLLILLQYMFMELG